MAKIVVVDSDECQECGTCEALAPGVFKMDEVTAKAIVIDPAGASEDEIQEAIDSCPAECIRWEEQ